MTVCKAPSTFPVDVHGNRGRANGDSDAANDAERVLDTLHGKPVVYIQRDAESEDIFDETHHGVRIDSLTTMRVNDVRHHTHDAELDARVDHTQAYYDRNRPGFGPCETLAPAKEPSPSQECEQRYDQKPELGFCWQGIRRMTP